jgi:cytochrome c-type biogenesis protein
MILLLQMLILLALMMTPTIGAFVLPPARQQHFQPLPSSSTTNKPTKTTTTTTTSLQFQWEDIIYSAESAASTMATTSLDNMSFTTLPIMYGAGLLTSVSPCVWGLLPLTMSYITTAAGERKDGNPTIPTMVFALGLASVFMSFGLIAATAGTLLGPSNIGLGILSNVVCLAMGLQLLELIELPLISLDFITKNKKKSDNTVILLDASGNFISNTNPNTTTSNDDDGSLLRTFLLGASSALVASPCATPVLTSILAFCAKTHQPVVGAGLLGMYSLGYSTPLLIVAATGGTILRRGQRAPWVTLVTGGLLVWIGTTGILTTLLGDASMAGLQVIE